MRVHPRDRWACGALFACVLAAVDVQPAGAASQRERLLAVESSRSVLRAAAAGPLDMDVSRANTMMMRAVLVFVGPEI